MKGAHRANDLTPQQHRKSQQPLGMAARRPRVPKSSDHRVNVRPYAVAEHPLSTARRRFSTKSDSSLTSPLISRHSLSKFFTENQVLHTLAYTLYGEANSTGCQNACTHRKHGFPYRHGLTHPAALGEVLHRVRLRSRCGRRSLAAAALRDPLSPEGRAVPPGPTHAARSVQGA